MWMKSGVRSVRIDHERFTVQPNSICFIIPGQRVTIAYDSNPSGWILTFSKEFFIRQTSENNTHQVHMISTFKDLVARHYTKYHRVSDYAGMMNISPKYLNQVVKKVMGVTARSIIQEQLIIHARRDLKFSNDSVKQIAFRLGYAEPFHFSSFFKKKVGCSPSDYRLQ